MRGLFLLYDDCNSMYSLAVWGGVNSRNLSFQMTRVNMNTVQNQKRMEHESNEV